MQSAHHHGSVANSQGSALRGALGPACPPLVFLAACESEAVGKELAAAGVQHVVATTRPVPTDVAMRFTSEFYTELVRGDSVQGAFDVASRTLRGLDAGVFVLLPAGADHTVRFLQ